MTITIYHNPACGTSRNTLAMIRQSGVEPTVIEYLKTPPSRGELVELISAMGVPVRDVMRKNVEPYETLGLADQAIHDEKLVDAMIEQTPMGRMASASELSAMVAWMCSEECSFTTGGVFDISGGRATY